MKKRILAVLLAVCLVMALLPTAAFATGKSSINYQLKCTVIMGQNSASMTATSSQLGLETDTLEAFLGVLAAGKFTMSNMELSIDLTKPCEIEIMNAAPATDTVNKKVIVTTNNSSNSEDDALVICSSSTVTIHPQSGNWSHNHAITFGGGIEIKEGATLQLNTNNVRDGSETEYIFNGDLVVNGTLTANDPDTVATLQTMTFQNGSALKIGKTGSATLVSTNVTGGNADPLIVNEGELLIGTAAYQSNEKAPTISAAGTAIQTSGTLTLDSGEITSTASDKPLIEATGGEVNLEKSQKTDERQQQYIPVPTLAAPSGAPAILVKENASLTAGIGNITSDNDNQPAVVVEGGGALTITTDDTYKSNAGILSPTITASGTQAVELKPEATVTNNAGVTATVSEENDKAGDNYVDNYGNIILAAKSNEDGTVSAEKVILDDGTTIEGTEEMPLQITYKADEETSETVTQVTVPANGSVQQPGDNEPTVLPGGGTVDGENITVNVAGVTLNSEKLSISKGDTATLTATVDPEDATNKTVTWSSDNENVATVDASGKVTAVGYGKAVITAKVGDIEATCTVIVPAPYIPPVNPNPSYSITAPTVDNGTLSVSPSSATKNTDVTITVTPDKDYELASLTVVDANGSRVPVKQVSDTKFTFTMPASKVTVSASFSKVVKTLPFTDVSVDDYFYDAVVWAVENGVTYGNTATTFGVGVTCNRADAVTFIWRAYGCPAPKSSENPFTDISESAYYYDAVLWAVENGITVGTSATTFSPLESCRREHIVTFLYRAAGSPTVSHSSGFSDVADSAYYANAVTWAAENGITVGAGSTTTFGPTQNCFREQIVTFLYRNLAE